MHRLVFLAIVLSLGVAISLGMARFAYALLLPVMRDDLGWSYALAGGMNTANAVGYLVGALAMPWLIRHVGEARVFLGGAFLTTFFMAAIGFFTDANMLLVQRLLAGVASAFVFVAGGLMAARLVAKAHGHGGLLLGIYYGGAGWGIAFSAVGVPVTVQWASDQAHAWAWAWWALAAWCLLASLCLFWPALVISPRKMAQKQKQSESTHARQKIPWWSMSWMFAGYALFGVGYIGYMTFVIALLLEQGSSSMAITVFYVLLGLAVVFSARLWAGLLDRARGGGALAILNALLGLATLLPVLSPSWPVVFFSGLLFGAVFLSLVASTTAFVRYNLPADQWAAGISMFTILFAFGQIVGPVGIGWVADASGGLEHGFVWSAGFLCLGALLAAMQKPLKSDLFSRSL